MREINIEETKKLLEKAIRRWFNTHNVVVVYDPIYEDETVDEHLISLKMEEISGGTLVVDPIFYGKQKDEIEELDFYNQPIKYEGEIFQNCEKLIGYLIEGAKEREEEREMEKILDDLQDQVYNITDNFQKRNNLEIKVRKDIEEDYNGFRTVTIFVKERSIK